MPADKPDVTLTASIGSVVKNASGTWNWSFPTNDGPPQSQTVTITADDHDGGVTQKTFPLVVNNVAPTITATFQVASIPEGSVSTSGNLVVQATDPAGSHDPLSFAFDCNNDGGFETPANPSTSAGDCFFDDNGSYTVGVQVSDGDGGVTTGTVIAVVTNVAPTAFLPGAGPVDEGSPATLTFENQIDPSSADTTAGFHYSIACDGNPASLATSYATAISSPSQACTYPDNGVYPVVGRIFDKDGGSNDYSASVTVKNVAPTVTATPKTQTIDENGTASLTIAVSDPGLPDTCTLTIHWGEDAPVTQAVSCNGSVTLTHQYLDDGVSPGNGSASDDYTVKVIVRDDDGGVGNASANVTVNNVAPTVSVTLDAASIDEDGSVTLDGTITDTGTLDGHKVDIAWADGGTDSITLAAGALTFTKTHQYLDDGVSPGNGTASDVYVVNVTVRDDDRGVGTASANVTVNNVAPTVSVTLDAASIDEDGSVTLDGTITDTGTLDGHKVVIDWVDGGTDVITLAAGALTFTKAHQYLDDGVSPGNGTASDVYAISVTVTDDDRGVGTASANVTVNNLAPVVNAGVDQTLPFGSLISVSASFTDTGTLDVWTYDIDWGDGTSHQTGSATPAGPITGSHQYVIPGDQAITVCVTDDDTGTHCDSLSITFFNTAGKITAGTLRDGNNGRGGFNVKLDKKDAVEGELQYQNGSANLHAHEMTAIAVSPDGKSGWFSGVFTNGSVFVAYVEDNGEGKKASGPDVFRLWVDGVLQNGDGVLTGGNVQIH